MVALFLDDNKRELKIETFSGRQQLQPDVTSSFVGYCACSCSPPCRRGPDVKLVCLALWRKREYLTFISIRFVAFSNQHFADYRSQIVLGFFEAHFKLDFQALLHLTSLNVPMCSCHRVKIQLGKQPTVSELDMGLNFPTSQIKVSRQKI